MVVMMTAAVTPRPPATAVTAPATAVTARFTRRRNEPDEQDREE